MKDRAYLELSPRERLDQLSQVCLACQGTVGQWFHTRGWTLSNWKCADATAIATDRIYHEDAHHDAMIGELWRSALAAPERSRNHFFFRVPRLLFRSQHS